MINTIIITLACIGGALVLVGAALFLYAAFMQNKYMDKREEEEVKRGRKK